MLNMLQNMYAKASSKVVTENSQSHVFRCKKGVRQGCNLSPLLFSLFLSDLEHHLTTNNTGNTQLHNIKINLLQFVDDLVLLADSPTGLQHSKSAIFVLFYVGFKNKQIKQRLWFSTAGRLILIDMSSN